MDLRDSMNHSTKYYGLKKEYGLLSKNHIKKLFYAACEQSGSWLGALIFCYNMSFGCLRKAKKFEPCQSWLKTNI